MQIIVDSTARGKPLFGSGDQGFNIVKFLLSVIAIIFDLIFMFQHYVLYRDKWAKKEQADERQRKFDQVQHAMQTMNQPGKDGHRFLSGGREHDSSNDEKVNSSRSGRLLNYPDE